VAAGASLVGAVVTGIVMRSSRAFNVLVLMGSPAFAGMVIRDSSDPRPAGALFSSVDILLLDNLLRVPRESQ